MQIIQTYNRIAPVGLARFAAEQFEVSIDSAQPDAILLRSQTLTPEMIPQSVNAIARAGAGVNNIPLSTCTERGIVVFNTPGANANAVKEMVLAGLLLSSRGIYQGLNYCQQQFDTSELPFEKQIELGKKRFAGIELKGKTLGVIGLGAIGAAVANMGLRLGMQVIGYDPALSVEAAWRLSSEVERAEAIPHLLGKADFISLHVPMIEQTRHLLNADNLGYCKPDARLLNFARGEIVDHQALLAALDTHKLACYVCDFPQPALQHHPKVLLLPHLGASTAEAEDNCAVMAADQLSDFLLNGNITNSVNFPSIRLQRSGGYRITFANHNVPKVLSNVLNLLADMNINVIDILNRSRNEIAYSILDIEQAITPELIAAIASVEHVFHVRAV